MNVISTCRYTRLMPHPCLHRSVVSLQFAPYLSSLSSHSGFGDHPKLLRLPVKEPSLTGLEHSGLLTCGLKGHSCCDTLTLCVCSLPHWWPHRRSHHCKYRHPFDVTRLLCGHAVLCICCRTAAIQTEARVQLCSDSLGEKLWSKTLPDSNTMSPRLQTATLEMTTLPPPALIEQE